MKAAFVQAVGQPLKIETTADPQPMLTEVNGFDALPARFESLRTPSTRCKILIDPSMN